MSNVNAEIDTTFDFRTDSTEPDPDKGSPTLQRYHRILWSKSLPIGGELRLSEARSGRARVLRADLPDRGPVLFSSDTLANSNKKPMRIYYDAMGEESNTHFHRYGGSIGGRLIFPSERIDGGPTINQRRGTHPRLSDRFDLALECIRRHYSGEESPIGDDLDRYSWFFDLFVNFDGYVDFFLLQDLLNDRGEVMFYLPFVSFEGRALPGNFDEYERFRAAQIDFVVARNHRIVAATQ